MKYKIGDEVIVKYSTKQIYNICAIYCDATTDYNTECMYKLKRENDNCDLGWWRESSLSSLKLVEARPDPQATEESNKTADSGAYDEPYTFPWEHEYPRNDCDGIGGYGGERGYKQGYESRKTEESKSAQMIVNYDADSLKAEYERGMNEAWEIARKIMQIPIQKRVELFSMSKNKACFVDISSKFSVSEAADKPKAWEDRNEIKVGDEVLSSVYPGRRYIVTAFDNMNHSVSALEVTGGAYHLAKNDITKTGKHYNQISEVLKKMQEET